MLDDLEQLKLLDKSDMLGILHEFPEQILKVATAIKETEFPLLEQFDPDKIMILGMGGSGIGGELLSALVEHEAKVPIITVCDYTLPAVADERTLVLACSYSGNTEETLSSVNEAFNRSCRIICITSGGKLEEFCKAHELSLFTIPSGMPPRAAIAFLFFPLPMILEKGNIVDVDAEFSEVIDKLVELRDSVVPEVPSDQNPAKILAMKFNNSIPVIYGHSYLTKVAHRWRTQLNENAKVLAMVGGFPDMNHNEIVGWSDAPEEVTKLFSVILLRSPDEHPQVSKRIELTKQTLLARAGSVFEVEAQGASRLTRMLTTIYLGDYISVYLALLREVDPTPVRAIEELKRKLVE